MTDNKRVSIGVPIAISMPALALGWHYWVQAAVFSAPEKPNIDGIKLIDTSSSAPKPIFNSNPSKIIKFRKLSYVCGFIGLASALIALWNSLKK